MTSPTELVKFQLYVHPSRRDPERYRIRMVAPDAEELSQSVTIRQSTPEMFLAVAARAPSAAPLEPISPGPLRTFVRNKLAGKPVACRLEIHLPVAPIAALPWEELGIIDLHQGIVCSVFRHPLEPGPAPADLLPITLPLRWGVLSLLPSSADVLAVLDRAAHEIEATYGRKLVEVFVQKEPSSTSDFIRQNRLNVLQLVTTAAFEHKTPVLQIENRTVALEDLLRSVVASHLRCLVVQNLAEHPLPGMAALRQATQAIAAAPMSTILCSASPARFRDSEFLQILPKDLLDDQPLDHIVSSKVPGILASVVVNRGIDKGLPLLEVSDHLLHRADRLHREIQGVQKLRDTVRKEPEREKHWQIDLGKIDVYTEAAKRAMEVVAPFKFRRKGGEPTSLSLQGDLQAALQDAGTHLTQAEDLVISNVARETQTTNEPPPRYPVIQFYHRVGNQQEALPITTTVTPAEKALELHFWLDLLPGGISHDLPVYSIRVPENVCYPVPLRVDAYSDDCRLDPLQAHREIQLQFFGATAHARFPLELLPGRERAVIFLFVRHVNDLIAVFRVETAVSEQPRAQEDAQRVNDVYLATNWFRFSQLSPGGALTLFFREEGDYLQVFTLRPEGYPWSRLGVGVRDFHDLTKKIYRAIQNLSYEIRDAIRDGKPTGFASGKGNDLAELGRQLFAYIFHLETEDEIQEFLQKYLADLPSGALLTVATDRNAQHFVIPWGLVYDGDPPREGLAQAVPENFWGLRYRLLVRPSLPRALLPAALQSPPSIATVYRAQKETPKLEDFLNQQFQAGKIQSPRALRVENHSIPGLGEQPYNLIHFFCHGTTDFGDDFTRELRQDLEQVMTANPSNQDLARLLLDQLKHVSTYGPYIQVNDIVTLTDLATNKVRLQGGPIVLLSMCESAQVSSAGKSFVTFFLSIGARAVIGTEGPNLFSMARELDSKIIEGLLDGRNLAEAFWQARKEMAQKNVLALIYTLFGDGRAAVVHPLAVPSSQ